MSDSAAITGLFTLLGALFGSGVTSVNGWLASKRERRERIRAERLEQLRAVHKALLRQQRFLATASLSQLRTEDFLNSVYFPDEMNPEKPLRKALNKLEAAVGNPRAELAPFREAAQEIDRILVELGRKTVAE